jgi:hypothetical protein
MTSEKNLDLAQRLLLRRGTPAAPAIAAVPTEVRSNDVIAIPTPDPDTLKYAIGVMIIEWSFRLPHAKIREFNAFLADNEALIAESCEKLMKGVHYRGTYMTTNGERIEFRTYWAYDSQDAHDQWEIGLRNRASNFVKALRRLRSYWISDPDGTHRHFSPGALFAKDPGGHFLGFTLETAEDLVGGGPAGRAASSKPTGRRKGRGKKAGGK